MYLGILWLQFSLILFGLWGGGSLSYQQFLTGQACPTIVFPVCYLITVAFLVLAFTFASQKIVFKWVFATVLGLGLLVSSFASLSQFMAWGSCPLTNTGLPMCYLAFTIFFGLFLSRIAHFYFRK